MPTYEYRCRGCRHAFERFQRMSDEPVRVCPACGERRVERLISAGGGIVFKGPGFYATDYRKPEPGGGEAGGAKASAAGAEASAADGGGTSKGKANGSRGGAAEKGGGGRATGIPPTGSPRRGGDAS